LAGVGGHVGLSRGVVLFVLLHLERFDAVRELDELDATLETGFRDVCADLGQQVVVASRLAAEPYILESSLILSVKSKKIATCTYLAAGSLVGIGLKKKRNKLLGFLADLLPVPLVEYDAPILALFDQVGEIL
jgi:hypothetical protein